MTNAIQSLGQFELLFNSFAPIASVNATNLLEMFNAKIIDNQIYFPISQINSWFSNFTIALIDLVRQHSAEAVAEFQAIKHQFEFEQVAKILEENCSFANLGRAYFLDSNIKEPRQFLNTFMMERF